MQTLLSQLPAQDAVSGLLNVIVDSPKGSRNKYKYEEDSGLWRLSKVLPLGMTFPFDFGFVPSTRGQDGDPLDVLILLEEPAFPGCVVPARLIGVLEAEQTEDGRTVRNDRLLAVLETRYNPVPFRSLDELSPQTLAEVEYFFIAYNGMQGRQFRILGSQGPDRAQEVLDAALNKPE
jgi:inorganic pyrophosphatase